MAGHDYRDVVIFGNGAKVGNWLATDVYNEIKELPVLPENSSLRELARKLEESGFIWVEGANIEVPEVPK